MSSMWNSIAQSISATANTGTSVFNTISTAADTLSIYVSTYKTEASLKAQEVKHLAKDKLAAKLAVSRQELLADTMKSLAKAEETILADAPMAQRVKDLIAEISATLE